MSSIKTLIGHHEHYPIVRLLSSSLIPTMTYVSNDPSWWQYIYWCYIFNYFIVASSTAVVYDWALTFAQEFDLVWQGRSFVNILYLCVRYIGILYSTTYILANLPVSMTDKVSNILYFITVWTPVVVNAMLGVIMMIRIYAMYQGSKKILVFLIVVLLLCTTAIAVVAAMGNINASGLDIVLSGNNMCFNKNDAAGLRLIDEMYIPTLVWEVLALGLSVWIVIKHIRELRQSPTTWIIEDCFTVLLRSHVLYFVGFAAVSFFYIGLLSPRFKGSTSVGSGIYYGVYQMTQFTQMFVLGPRLVLSIRNYNAKLVANSGEGTHMDKIVFQECRHATTSVGV
ncbi:hypothetical protein CY34DRAFT_463206 [Suillus luteus UH-Slu-Lm8-n1]|uniref:Unplaced genomic scaffold CY34scaffold_33, whole genome shotgun sequence n=1 Tax=Suillus luteus UH-Slu-Lm8-n1 TaxID=930992 RepID=A0A0D0AWH8_9AGAM|nr:hypothetical protein CY34DRAFT_463206 [Suillus luteus UH-Slu-Lm8-n1]